MLLADARLPTGAHTQSAGLEPAIRAGLPAESIPAYIRARLRTVTTVEAGAAIVARSRTLTGTTDLAADLAKVDLAWRARTVSPASAAATPSTTARLVPTRFVPCSVASAATAGASGHNLDSRRA